MNRICVQNIFIAGWLCISVPLFGATLDVKALGAKGDGTADDSQNIAQAIKTSQPGDAILFPAGSYKLLTKVVLLPNRRYTGQAGAVILAPANTFAFSVPNGRDIAIDNLVFNGSGIEFVSTSGPAENITIRSCVFQNIFNDSPNWTTHNALFISGGMAHSAIESNRFTNILEAGKIDPTDRTANAIQAWDLSSVSIADNVFDTINQAISIHFDGAGPYENVAIVRNTGVRIHRMGIEIQGANTVGLLVEDNSFSAFLAPFWNTFGLSIVADGGRSTVVRGNQLTATDPSTSRYGYGIEVSGKDTLVEANIIRGFFSTGIAIGTSQGMNIRQNTLCGSAGATAIAFEADSQPGTTMQSNTSQLVCP
ncbi:MAG: glycosyl hydrolase family 28-related protein [Bryobacteraceae bacterium]